MRIAQAGGPAAPRLADALRAFASRALQGRRLAYALVVEPVDPEVDDARLRHRRALARLLETIVADGVRSGEFPSQDVEASAACPVGALLEGLVGPLAPAAARSNQEGAPLIEAIVSFCTRAVSGRAE